MAGSAKWAARVVAACLLAGPLAAQNAQPVLQRTTPPAIKWGKWAAAAAAVSFTTLGIRQHNAADAAFNDLVNYCRTTLCTLTPAGHYADPRAESRYQTVVRDDRWARAWLISGQVAALATAALFVLELRSNREPPNIPYSGLVLKSDARGARLGWRIAF